MAVPAKPRARRADLLRQALDQHRLARGAARDGMEGVDLIAALADQALENPKLAQRALRTIAATASNTLDSLEDAAAAFAKARQLIERVRG